MKDPWRLLGIPRGSNANSIRKAYAAKIKQFHPEEHPEEFKQLNDTGRPLLTPSSKRSYLMTTYRKRISTSLKPPNMNSAAPRKTQQQKIKHPKVITLTTMNSRPNLHLKGPNT